LSTHDKNGNLIWVRKNSQIRKENEWFDTASFCSIKWKSYLGEQEFPNKNEKRKIQGTFSLL
jgi:hypothetical protein